MMPKQLRCEQSHDQVARVCRRTVEVVIGTTLVLLAGVGQRARGDDGPFVFKDVCEESGLLPHVAGMHGHGAAWGDANGDGWIDHYVGTFHTEGPANRLLQNKQGRFHSDDQQALQISTRATGIVFADLDNDGDLDLYVASMPAPEGSRLATRAGHALAGCTLFRNEGEGRFTNRSQDNGACPLAFGGRSVAVLDYDGDGLLDLFLPSWWTGVPSLLLRNGTPGGHWLDVRIEGAGPVNRQGIGSRINLYAAGKLGDRSGLVGSREISVGYGYASGQPANAHFGLGEFPHVDVVSTIGLAAYVPAEQFANWLSRPRGFRAFRYSGQSLAGQRQVRERYGASHRPCGVGHCGARPAASAVPLAERRTP